MSEFSRPLAVDRIGPAASVHTVEARPDELPAIAARMQIQEVGRLTCRFTLRRITEGVIAADGKLEAVVTQVCVVTLEAFEQRVEEAFSVRFVPAGTETEDEDPESPDEIPYEGGSIDLGEAAAEQLALALDPYPKKPGATGEDGEPAEASGPFAALAGLRRTQ